METINQCYICKSWFVELSLERAKVPDQVGYLEKPVCKECLKEIQERSKT